MFFPLEYTSVHTKKLTNLGLCIEMYQTADLPDFSEGREMLGFVVSRITANPADSDGRMLELRSMRVRLSDSLSKVFRMPPACLFSASSFF